MTRLQLECDNDIDQLQSLDSIDLFLTLHNSLEVHHFIMGNSQLLRKSQQKRHKFVNDYRKYITSRDANKLQLRQFLHLKRKTQEYFRATATRQQALNDLNLLIRDEYIQVIKNVASHKQCQWSKCMKKKCDIESL